MKLTVGGIQGSNDNPNVDGSQKKKKTLEEINIFGINPNMHVNPTASIGNILNGTESGAAYRS